MDRACSNHTTPSSQTLVESAFGGRPMSNVELTFAMAMTLILHFLLATLGLLALGCSSESGSSSGQRSTENVGTVSSALTGSTDVFWFDTYADLRANPGGNSNSSVNVAVHRGVNPDAGAPANGDAIGAGVFVWTLDAATADDGVTVIAPTSSRAGCWKRVFDNTVNVQWFGAICDGSTADDVAFQNALDFANAVSGTILLPAGKTCLLTQTFDLGCACQVGKRSSGVCSCSSGGSTPASSVTFRGPGAPTNGTGTTIKIQPATSQTGTCAPWTNDTTAPTGGPSGGIAMPPNTSNITFENIELSAGSNLSSCIVNMSNSGSGDPIFNTFRRTTFVGNGSTQADVYLYDASWPTFDGCFFATGSTNHIWDDPSDGYLSNATFVRNTFWLAGGTGYDLRLNDPAAITLTGNNFEVSPNAIYIGNTFGGTISSNWFNMEGVSVSAGTLADIGCAGCTIDGNWMDGGFVGLNVRGTGAVVTGDYFLAQQSTSMVIASNANDIAVEGLFFDGSSCSDTSTCGSTTCTQIDLDVQGGDGHRIGNNLYRRWTGSPARVNKNSVRLGSGTYGTLALRSADDGTACGYVDNSSGGWRVDKDGTFNTVSATTLTCGSTFTLDASGTNNIAAINVSRSNLSSDGAFLNIQNDSGQNNFLVLNDTVSGGAYGGIQMNKAGTVSVNIAAASLAGPTYFNAGDDVGIGTIAPNAKLEVNGGVRINTSTTQPSCASTTDGTFWVVQGGSGVKDSVQVCAKDASNAYAWRTIY
jgi:hypothetical protein